MANPEILLTCHPLMGEEFTVRTGDFASLADAVRAVEHAMDVHQSLTLTMASTGDTTTKGDSVVVNLAAMTSVRVGSPDSSSDAGHYP